MYNKLASKEHVRVSKSIENYEEGNEIGWQGEQGTGTRLEKLAETRQRWAFVTSTLLRHLLMLFHSPHALLLSGNFGPFLCNPYVSGGPVGWGLS